ncbi:MAG: hypothetical protein OXE47_09095 [Gammaproteobacteria bacterium]|nr:hypothetical protein [Gammaproteobacteria bacterium]
MTVFHLFCLLFKLCVLGVFDVGGAGLERLEFFLLVGCCAQPGAAGRRAEFETIAGVIREHCMCVIYTHVCGVCGFLFCRGAGAFAIADFGGDFVESAGCVGEQRAGELQTYLFCGVAAHFKVVGEAFGEVYVGDLGEFISFSDARSTASCTYPTPYPQAISLAQRVSAWV